MKTYHFEQIKWKLDGLLPAAREAGLQAMMKELEVQVSQFEAGRERLCADISDAGFLELVRLTEAISAAAARLSAYATLWFSEDTQSQEAIGFLGRVDQLLAEIENRVLFFSLWWKALDEENARRLLAVSGDTAYYLETLRRFKPYALTEPEEKIINLKDVTGSKALDNLYQMIANRFSFELEVDGQVKRLTRDELAAYVRSPSPDVRAAAYQELYRVYSDQGPVLGQIYNYLVRDWFSENVAVRGFSSPIAVRNLANDIPDPVVETLLEVCRHNMPLFHRYFQHKARWIGVDRLRRYDIYAPLSTADRTYGFPEAADRVLDSLDRFSPTLADHGRTVFSTGHLDSEIRPGKLGGAFCYPVAPDLVPWVLVNYVGKVGDVLTLAHEIGHAVHGSMAAGHSVLTYRSSLPLAETASVFSEMLTVDSLRSGEADAAVLRDLLVTVMDGAYATVARQAFFVLFEIAAHERIAQGATTDDLCALYLENLYEQFGDAVEISDDFRWEWTAIPHFYDQPFYCYAYSFGHLLVLALYQQYRQEGASFVPRYLRILSYGGSASPAHIISEAGFDMASPEFWQGGFDVLAGMLDDLQAL